MNIRNRFIFSLLLLLPVSVVSVNAFAAVKKAKPVAKAITKPKPVAQAAAEAPAPSVAPATPTPALPEPEVAATPAATPALPEVAAPAASTPAPAVAPPAPVAAAAEEKKYDYGKTNRPLGDFLVGPYVTALALPRPISFGLEMKYLDLFGLSGGYGFFPQLKFDTVKLKITGWDARLKIYPFKGSFFIGAAMGSQTFTGSASQTISGIAANVSLKQDNTFIAPHIGWNWIWGSGIFMGLDLGVQLSMNRKTTLTDDANAAVTGTAEYAKIKKDLLDNADKIGKTPLPLLTLIKLGYLF